MEQLEEFHSLFEVNIKTLHTVFALFLKLCVVVYITDDFISSVYCSLKGNVKEIKIIKS